MRGVSLIELMIAMAISLVVSLAMVSLMANTLGSGTQTISMARLTQELRAATQIMTREVRRANFHANFTKCFGNVDCRSTLDDGDADASGYVKAITVGTSVSANDCFFFWYDRDADGDITDDDDVAAFRRRVSSGVGRVEMAIASNTIASCSDGNVDWTRLTDPDVVNVTALAINNGLSYTDTIDGGASQRVDKIQVTLTGQLVSDATITRSITDVIRVRNDIFAPAP